MQTHCLFALHYFLSVVPKYFPPFPQRCKMHKLVCFYTSSCLLHRKISPIFLGSFRAYSARNSHHTHIIINIQAYNIRITNCLLWKAYVFILLLLVSCGAFFERNSTITYFSSKLYYLHCIVWICLKYLSCKLHDMHALYPAEKACDKTKNEERNVCLCLITFKKILFYLL